MSLSNKLKSPPAYDLYAPLSISGSDAGSYYLDLKNGSGACGPGAPPDTPDATFVMKDKDFHAMFAGEREKKIRKRFER